ncbi:mycoredoxin [Epidermidibacterium keratini]|uniref:Mycoredoxin n=1 Tax=Epidermidibacterium keratini TaxID=1891644 RepID=A0A7L4YQS8_9ACTN|nr:mycoredoxin [Epidermidibacterium keratini]QHC01605.1 mycoredoxin [Epidermidibacterium keratini]
MATSEQPAITMYSTTWCPFCTSLRADLNSAGIEYAEVDVDRDPEAGELVKSLNNGNRVVPTLVFADGSSLTNPSVDEVQTQLAGSAR